MQLETSVAGMEKINYCEVVISTDQEKEDILNILNELEEEFPGLVSDDVKANTGELVAKFGIDKRSFIFTGKKLRIATF